MGRMTSWKIKNVLKPPTRSNPISKYVSENGLLQKGCFFSKDWATVVLRWRHMINTDTPWSPEDRRCLVYLVLFTMSNKLGKFISKQLSNLSLPTRYEYTQYYII